MGVSKVTSKIPSLGGFTPLEGLLKGGSARDLFSPKNWMSDTMLALQKPSTVLNAEYLSGQGDKGGKSLTSTDKEADKNQLAGRERKFVNEYGEANTFRNRKDSGLQV